MIVVFLLSLATASPAVAEPVWNLRSMATSHVPPGGTFQYLIAARNVGDAPTDGGEYTITITLPPGVTGVGLQALNGNPGTCSDPAGASVITCSRDGEVAAGAMIPDVLWLDVAVDSGASGILATLIEISGAGAVPASTVDPTVISSTSPGFAIDAFDGGVVASPAGEPYTQAAGRPYALTTTVDFTTESHPVFGPIWPTEPPKNLLVDVPPGLVGNPSAAASCTFEQLAQLAEPLCPVASQVGTIRLRMPFFGDGGGGPGLPELPVFNMEAPPGVPARFGFNTFGTVVTFDAAVRSDADYGLAINARNISEGAAIAGTTITFWGVPADPRHDVDRWCDGFITGGCASQASLRAFLTMPTSCTAPGEGLIWRARADSWFNPGVFDTASYETHEPPGYPRLPEDWGPPVGVTGCEDVPFNPTFTAAPVDSTSPGPSGYAFDLRVPQTDDPELLAQGHVRDVSVTLPEGVRVSPSSASGLGACAPSEIALGSSASPTCPLNSKIGAVRLETPLLEEPMTGSIFLAKPHDNPSNSLLALYIVAEGSGVVIKLPGRVDPDPSTGRLTATFEDNPQLPFELLHLEFKGGPRAALSNPPRCGTYGTTATITSWSGKTVTSESSFTTSADGHGAPCPPPGFSPKLTGGSVNPIAGDSSAFTLTFSREDVDEELRDIALDMPEGLLARIADVAALCPAEHAAVGTCDEGSRVGSVMTEAGPGSSPFALDGRVYMSGPYKGAPFSLSIVVPALAGPFDLGTVVVRAAVHVHKRTSALRIVSDPLPTILQGIPLQIRSVNVRIDKAGFMVNPTDCSVKRLAGRIASVAGSTAERDVRFQVGECANLRFAPKMRLQVGAKRRTQAGVSTPLTASIRQTAGQANLQSVKVVLPATLNARLPVINRACSLEEFETGRCGDDAKAGRAVATTPLLRDPLSGPAYFVRNPARTLPDLMIALRGQVDIDLVGKVSIPGGKRLSTTFDTIPDVPIRSFKLRLVAGQNGPLGVARNLCSKKGRQARARIAFQAQSGKRLTARPRLAVKGCARR